MPTEPYVLAIDFDGTATPKEHGSLMRYVELQAVPHACRRILQRLRRQYFSGLRAGTLTYHEETVWYDQIVAAYVQHHVSIHEMCRAIDAVRVRPGFVQFLEQQKAQGARIVIVSYGIANLISYVLWNSGVRPGLIDEIAAADLVTNDMGIVMGMRPASMVIPSHKGSISQGFARRCGVPPERIIGIGDSLGDRNIGCSKAMRIGLVSKESEAGALRPFMDHVVEIDDRDLFDPVGQIVNRLIDYTPARHSNPRIVIPEPVEHKRFDVRSRVDLEHDLTTLQVRRRYIHVPPHLEEQVRACHEYAHLSQHLPDTVELVKFPNDTCEPGIRSWIAANNLRPLYLLRLIALDLAHPDLYKEGPILGIAQPSPGRGYSTLDEVSGGRVIVEEWAPDGVYSGDCWFALEPVDSQDSHEPLHSRASE